MSAESRDPSVALEQLSALVDGEVDAQLARASCAQWRDDANVRTAWHRYHLIGDVLRSDDLASTTTRDELFLAALRVRMANEPVVMAPQPQELATGVGQGAAASAPAPFRPGGRRLPWAASSAVAAGFVVVAAGVSLLMPRAPVSPPSSSATLADANVASSPRTVLVTAPTTIPVTTVEAAASTAQYSTASIELQPLVVNGRFIRDARLDRYLAAHKQFAGSSALGVPSVFLRSATVDIANR